MSEHPVLWRPTQEQIEGATLTRYMAALKRDRGLEFADYEQLRRWSVDDLGAFWQSVAEFCELQFDRPPQKPLGSLRMPGAEFLPGARVSYPRNVFRGKDRATPAIQHASELRPLGTWTWGRLEAETAAVAAGLQRLGVGPGDRVVAYMPNIPETVAAFLATTSLGAIWSSAAPEFGARTVIDRFSQVEPKVLLAVDGYRYGGRDHDRREIVAQIAAAIPSKPTVITYGYLDASGWPRDFPVPGAELTFTAPRFDDPLWILYSSGTTGLPKAIVQSHGGILLEHAKLMHLHLDAKQGDRVFWFTTTGWMMWNFLVGVLLTEASIVLFDGNPGHPSLDRLWDLASEAQITTFGTSAAYINSCMKAGTEPRGGGRDLRALRAVGSTGSPLSPEGFRWVYDRLGAGTWLFSTSGGTDVCTAFVGGVPTLPVREGELQARALGAAVEAWNEDGEPVVGEMGELVITRPMPSMPVYFWGDEGGARYRESYFSMFPGIWRHGDWIEITPEGGAIIHGRSDSTINRGGVRIGTAEIYAAVLAVPEVQDALVVDLPKPDTDGSIELFVVLGADAELDDELRGRIRAGIRRDCSPRHVPDNIVAVPQVPRTLSGKPLEVPVKRILCGTPPERAASRESLADPAALDLFVAMADER